MKERGLRMTAERYKSFILDRIAEIKNYSNPETRSIYFPRNLFKSLQPTYCKMSLRSVHRFGANGNK